MKFFLLMIKNQIFDKKPFFFLSYTILVLSCFFILFCREIFIKKEIIFRQDIVHYIPFKINSKQLSKEWIQLKKLPAGLKEYLIKVEDKRFYHHKGISLTDIQNVAFNSFVLNKKIRGASTITQQLSRTLFLEKEDNLTRKWKEMCIAISLEKTLSKEKILEYYLNMVYWGANIYGIQKASRYYFQKDAPQLKENEWKFLINSLKKPNFYLKNKLRKKV